jgi:hypothetical protein
MTAACQWMNTLVQFTNGDSLSLIKCSYPRWRPIIHQWHLKHVISRMNCNSDSDQYWVFPRKFLITQKGLSLIIELYSLAAFGLSPTILHRVEICRVFRQYCDVGLPPVQFILSMLSAYIMHTWHSYIHTYIHTFIQDITYILTQCACMTAFSNIIWFTYLGRVYPRE